MGNIENNLAMAYIGSNLIYSLVKDMFSFISSGNIENNQAATIALRKSNLLLSKNRILIHLYR